MIRLSTSAPRPTPHTSQHGGYFVVLVLVFGAIFLALVSSLTGFIFVEQKTQVHKEVREKALQIAEAGLDYYKWYLAHYPDDTGDSRSSTPLNHAYSDPEGGVTGNFTLDITGSQQCGEFQYIKIFSTGVSDDDPSISRTVSGKYSRPSVAEYSYILDSTVWAGADRVINGPYHSNGGIRMDGTNNSLVTSELSSWLCNFGPGCSPPQTVDGVYSDAPGPGAALWQFPVTHIDFDGVSADLNLMEQKTKDESLGLYFNPIGGQPEQKGRHLIFKADGTVDVYTVLSTNWMWGYGDSDYDGDNEWYKNYHSISNENFMGNYTVPSGCGLIFAASNVWIEGTVNGKVTVAAANLSNPNVESDIFINDNLDYATYDGTSGLTAVAEGSVLIPLLSPDDMVVRGVFIAKDGHFGRNHYDPDYLTSSQDPYVLRNSLTITGSIVSKGRVGTQWSSGGAPLSGYLSRTNNYDSLLAADPPPMTPFASPNFRFTEWREE